MGREPKWPLAPEFSKAASTGGTSWMFSLAPFVLFVPFVVKMSKPWYRATQILGLRSGSVQGNRSP